MLEAQYLPVMLPGSLTAAAPLCLLYASLQLVLEILAHCQSLQAYIKAVLTRPEKSPGQHSILRLYKRVGTRLSNQMVCLYAQADWTGLNISGHKVTIKADTHLAIEAWE